MQKETLAHYFPFFLLLFKQKMYSRVKKTKLLIQNDMLGNLLILKSYQTKFIAIWIYLFPIKFLLVIIITKIYI